MGSASLMLGFLFHALLLHNVYARRPSLYRTELQQQHYFGFMLLADLLIGIGLSWIYQRGHGPGKGALMQGARFGTAIALVSTIAVFMIYFPV